MVDGTGTFLPRVDWTQREDLAELVKAMGQGNARWVGGAVRDTLLGVDAVDVDCATPLHPEEVMKRLKDAGIRVVPTGLDHGTVTAVLPSGPVEITTLRHDVSTDGRRATVKYATEWREDAARRDFTINALYADPDTLEIFDYFDGLPDLDIHRVRFIGDARERIREDHLRILRYYRFQARFGSLLDGEAEEACADLADTLKGLSRERVAMEMLKLLALPAPGDTILRMFERGVLGVVLPEATQGTVDALEQLVSTERREQVDPDAIRRFAALLPPDKGVAQSVASRLRLSRAQRERLSRAAQRNESDIAAPRALAYRLGMECALDRLLLQGADTSSLKNWQPPVFPLKGGEIIAMGVSAGPQIAHLLRAVEALWIEEGFPDRSRVEHLLKNAISG